MARRVIYLSIPCLRLGDVSDPSVTPTLHGWANAGAVAELVPSFPCVTSPVQATTWTGVEPASHGIIANGVYHRDRKEVTFWVERNGAVGGEQIWQCIARAGGMTSAVWHAQNIKDAAADFIVTPEPIHHSDGRTESWCYSKPDGLYQQLAAELGHFPLHHYWGPLANIESTKWIIAGAQWLIRRHDPDFHYIYIPHLDYASQKFGPDSAQAVEALRELDVVLGEFNEFVMSSPGGENVIIVAASEYAMTNVSTALYPNIALRKCGLLRTRDDASGEIIDFDASRAFAMVDHQLAHVYADAGAVAEVVELFRGTDGIEGMYTGDGRRNVGVDHPRAGEVVLVARDDHWFAYYWWLDASSAPSFARTVDIHRKPGFDPVELFVDPATKSIPLDASLVKGSHGVPAIAERHRGAIVCSRATSHIESIVLYRDTDVKAMVLGLLGIPAV